MEPDDADKGPAEAEKPLDFIRTIVAEDNRTGKYDRRVVTRFPPEPNAHLHIGHAKAICLSYGIAEENKGTYHLRFDDTNPIKEEAEYVEAMQEEIRWLGYDWGKHLYFASDYFEQLYGHAVQLIKLGKAYVCSLDADQIREFRGTLTEPGRESPYRNRSVEENLDLFERMRHGEFPNGAHVLRAKIDMASPNLNMRDPVIYRILHATHHRTGDKWCIYPMYDFTHCLSDSIERITHSLCSLEFEDHRPLYDWFLDELGLYHPQQIEFARLNFTYTILSKRRLLQVVGEGHVDGWDDPRLMTLAGLRRRGCPPEVVKKICDRVGVAKRDSVVEIELFEHTLREHLNRHSSRAMAVLRPIKVVLENYPDGQVEEMEIPNNPEDPNAGSRKVPFSRTLYIERDDFREEPPPKFFRLSPGREVRLRAAYLVTCTGVVKDERGEIVEVRCTYDPATRGGSAPDNRRVKGTLHWVSAEHACQAEVRLFDHLFTTEDPSEGGDFRANLNPKSLERLTGCFLEPSLQTASPGDRFQFERVGYFCVDCESTAGSLVFNRTVTLRDSWAKIEKGQVGKS